MASRILSSRRSELLRDHFFLVPVFYYRSTYLAARQGLLVVYEVYGRTKGQRAMISISHQPNDY